MSELHLLAGQLPNSMSARVAARLDDLLEAIEDDEDEPKIDVDSWRHAMKFLAASGIVEPPAIGLTHAGHTYLQ